MAKKFLKRGEWQGQYQTSTLKTRKNPNGSSVPLPQTHLVGETSWTGPITADPALRTNWFFAISVKHIPTGEQVDFEGWATQFSDTYTPSWNTTPVYGRMDHLATFQGTTRNIQLGFDIVNDSEENAKFNLLQIAKFMQFQYPVYDRTVAPGTSIYSAQQADAASTAPNQSVAPTLSQQTVLKAAPLLSIKWTNLISSPNNEEQRLMGYINGGISYSPDLNAGGFIAGDLLDGSDTYTGDRSQIKNYIPKKVSLSFNFTVVHTHLAGWVDAADPSRPASNSDGSGTKTFYFGGDRDINSRFPNAYATYPDPEELAAAEAAEDAELDEMFADAGMPEFSDDTTESTPSGPTAVDEEADEIVMNSMGGSGQMTVHGGTGNL
tara:strand:+ start:375 stop:1511 length:1137 start_codon:yes stop_codon:yes gene_type:complete